ncbi:MAG: ATP-binding cassette domain-containing protein [Acetobacter sp.]|nr:ATP-binding cassette domain-containing protein [Acetobacter sp.]
MALPPLLHVQDVSLSFGGQPLLTKVDLRISKGERLCLVGRNGSGKSTLLKIAAGLLQPDSGRVFLQPGTSLYYLPQEPSLCAHATTADYAQAQISDSTMAWRATTMLEALGLTGKESTQHLSGGEARRCALAGALAAAPDILLLDEPTNHLDMPTIEWLERELLSLGITLVMISHDRRFLSTLSQAVLWLDRGVTHFLNKNFNHFEAWQEEVHTQEERDAHKRDRLIAREEDWMRYGITARRKRNIRRVKELAALRAARRETLNAVGTVALTTTTSSVSSRLVSVAENVSKSWGERVIVRNFTLRLLRGDRLGIIGANGAGRTTLLRLITGQDQPDQGSVTLGPSLQSVTLDQQRRTLNPEWSLVDTLTDKSSDYVQIGTEKRHVFSYMKDFLFRPEQACTPVGALSGGERGRLALACALLKPSNLIVLDEPTNDLDLETLDVLQERLSTYQGTVVLVSHDRDFLDRIVTSILVPEDDGHWVEYAGGYSDMLAQRRQHNLNNAPLVQTTRDLKNRSKTPENTPLKTGAKKLSYKEQHLLDKLPAEIEKTETTIATLREKLLNPDLYTQNPMVFEQITTDLQKAEHYLAECEERWLELEIKRESLRSNT